MSRPQGHSTIGGILCQWKIHWHQLESNQRPSSFYSTRVNLILFTPIRNIRSSSSKFPRSSQFSTTLFADIYKKVKWSCYRPDVTQRVGTGKALFFHEEGWVVSSTPRPHFTSRKHPVPILQEAGWAPGPPWTGGKSRPHRDSIPDRPARSQSLYRLSYPTHTCIYIHTHTHTHTPNFTQIGH